GDWDGDGRTGLAIVRGRTWHLRDTATGGGATSSFALGACGDAFVGSARTVPPVPVSLRGTEWTVLPTDERVVALTFDA
ncbi:hypothetical protein PU560_00105, partial [Georgenia sp. 10Sc9-8]|nr:hypothetical protein [Georgenia halotolerans]